MSLRERLVFSSLQHFFQNKNNIDQLLHIVSGKDTVSLRLLDWYVTNYTKHKGTQYNCNGKQFIVFLDYKAQLKSFNKKLFDPFCRRKRISFQYDPHDPSKTICTTVGQLNFFKWAIQNRVIEHLHTCVKDVEQHMNSNKKITSSAKKVKRHEVVIVLTFN